MHAQGDFSQSNIYKNMFTHKKKQTNVDLLYYYYYYYIFEININNANNKITNQISFISSMKFIMKVKIHQNRKKLSVSSDSVLVLNDHLNAVEKPYAH